MVGRDMDGLWWGEIRIGCGGEGYGWKSMLCRCVEGWWLAVPSCLLSVGMDVPSAGAVATPQCYVVAIIEVEVVYASRSVRLAK